ALQTEINTIATYSASTGNAELTQSFTRLQQINTQLSLTVVPATAPATLQLSHLQTYSTSLKKHFEIVVIPNGPANLFTVYLQVEALAAQASPPAAELTARFGDLQTLQTTIGAAGIVPATAPASLTAAILQGYITQLIDHLNTNVDLNTFKQAVKTKTQHARAEFRYYFFVGLALLMDEANNWFFYVLDAVRNEAIRSFMHAHWQGVIPTPNSIAGSNITTNAARQVSHLTEQRDGAGNIGINPYEEYNNHIITRNASP
ncbi:MAG: hypothetical protein KDD99_28765, partial [Bacteroidetes bacterium]|nr:hypothetical protein [Bacteroidota bacterium]